MKGKGLMSSGVLAILFFVWVVVIRVFGSQSFIKLDIYVLCTSWVFYMQLVVVVAFGEEEWP